MATFHGTLDIMDGTLPTLAILGHSIPMLIQSYLDNDIVGSELGLDIALGKMTVSQAYARSLRVSNYFSEISFYYAQNITSELDDLVNTITDTKPDILLVQMGAWDLGFKTCNVEAVAKAD